MHHEDERLRLILAVALVSIMVGGTIDPWMDQPQDWLSFHVVFESTMIAGAMVMATTLWLGWWRSARSVEALRRSLHAREEERDGPRGLHRDLRQEVTRPGRYVPHPCERPRQAPLAAHLRRAKGLAHSLSRSWSCAPVPRRRGGGTPTGTPVPSRADAM